MGVEQVIRSVQERLQNEQGGALPRRRELLRELGQVIRRHLVESSDLDTKSADARDRARGMVQRFLEAEEAKSPLLVLAPQERAQIEEYILTGIFGFGILTPFIHDESVTEIMVNALDRIFVEQHGKMVRVQDRDGRPLAFQDKAELLAVVEKIVAPLNRKVDESDPITDARLPDGSRVNVVLSPVALDGVILTIRKFPQQPFSLEQLAFRGAFPVPLLGLFTCLVRARVNIMVSGSTSSGKTTFLNALGMVIPGEERVVTVEDAAELRFTQVENLARMEARPANIEGKGQIQIRDLVKTSLRMRPDRIIVGEVRGGEALDMLQAMNTGHDGSLTTAHANSAGDLLSRLETMVLMSGMELPVRAIREQVASAVEVIIHLARLPGGRRRVVQVSEVVGIEHGEIILADLFRWDPHAGDSGQGDLQWTGRQMTRIEKFSRYGVSVPRLEEVLV